MSAAYRLVLTVSLSASLATLALAEDPPKVNYKDNVLPLLQAKCNACHNNDQKKGGLALDNYSSAMAGGGSGAVVEPGDPDNSRLYLLAAHDEEPAMPPNSPKIPDADLATLRAWIEAGAPETSGSVVAMKAKPKLDFALDPAAMGKPQGDPAMPEGLSSEPYITSPRPNAVIALAASPWAPLFAVGGHKQILLYHAETSRLLGVLPFPEGSVESLRFSRDGGILLVGGGRTAQKGLAVGFDVKTGERLFEVGSEFDLVLSADISPDRSLIAIGGPSRVVRVFRTADGELAYECRKHTEWVTAVAFSPDGVLLATGDRNGGLLVWEAGTGREFHDLRGHSALISDLAWRLDSNLLASASEDGSARLWEMQNGNQIKTWNPHAGGVASIALAKDARILTTGRDRLTKLWDPSGNPVRDFEAFPDIALKAAFRFDDAAVIASDWSGEVRVSKTDDGARLFNLAANPAPLTDRIEQTRQELQNILAQAEAATQELAPLLADASTKAEAQAAAQAALSVAQQSAEKHATALKAAQDAAAALDQYITAAADLAPTDQAAAARADLATRITELDAASQKTTQEAAAATASLEAATQARTASDTAANAKSQAVSALTDRAAQIKAELDSLLAESQPPTTASNP